MWTRPHFWAPYRKEEGLALRTHFDLKEALDYPDAIMSSDELIFHEPVRMGERVHQYQILRSVSDLKTTKLGRGRFWVIDVECHNQRGEWLGTDTMTVFGYRKGE